MEENENKLEKKELLTIAEANGMIVPKNLSDTIFNTLGNYTDSGRLVLPPNFSAENALKTAWLKLHSVVDKLKKPALEVCTKESIANALLETCILGLNPAKTQCYYIVYDDVLTMMPSYFGKQMALKRVEGVEAINANVIYEGDTFTYDIRSDGSIFNLKHTQVFENIDENKIKGGYATITFNGEIFGVVQNYAQIVNAWKGAKGYGKEKETFKAEFTKRTMINLVVKHFLQTTDDSDILKGTLVQNENQHYQFDNEEDDKPNYNHNVVAQPEKEEKEIPLEDL